VGGLFDQDAFPEILRAQRGAGEEKRQKKTPPSAGVLINPDTLKLKECEGL
jgi:hypothetical protein